MRIVTLRLVAPASQSEGMMEDFKRAKNILHIQTESDPKVMGAENGIEVQVEGETPLPELGEAAANVKRILDAYDVRMCPASSTIMLVHEAA